jgi:hypothetical protein
MKKDRDMRIDTDVIIADAAFAAVFGLLGTAALGAALAGAWWHWITAAGFGLGVWVNVQEIVKLRRKRKY